jgi:16S rRNA (guanine527-N7)-methyltransferase
MVDDLSPANLTQFPRLREISRRIGVNIDVTATERFLAYRDLLFEANQRFNLTRITDPDDFEIRVLADSVLLLNDIPDDAQRLLDVGTGGGVPGLVLAIARPEMSVTLLDATGKKVRFLADAAAELGLTRVSAIQGRAEELAHDHEHRESYDVVTARAVARLATLAELTLPFARSGGRVILPKGATASEELSEACFAIGVLGGKARPLAPAIIEGTCVVVVDKERRTPEEYPRRTGVPKKLPLRRDT